MFFRPCESVSCLLYLHLSIIESNDMHLFFILPSYIFCIYKCTYLHINYDAYANYILIKKSKIKLYNIHKIKERKKAKVGNRVINNERASLI